MAYDFKKLSDVAVVETLADTANVLIEEDGVIKKVAKGEVGGVQPDWNQNDPTAKDYVKNRPFWTDDPAETVLLEETELTFVDGGAKLPTTIQLEEGQTYIVTCNGVDYECVAWFHGGIHTIFVGNGVYAGSSGMGNGEPFLTNGEAVMGEGESATIKILAIEREVHTIDPKYLPQPDMVITVNGMPRYNSKPSLTDVRITSGSFEALENLIRSGTVPNVVVRFCHEMNYVGEYRSVEASEYKAAITWYGAIAYIRIIVNDRNGNFVNYVFMYEEGELTDIKLTYHDGTSVS
jgi:hypothetical protein